MLYISVTLLCALLVVLRETGRLRTDLTCIKVNFHKKIAGTQERLRNLQKRYWYRIKNIDLKEDSDQFQKNLDHVNMLRISK